MEREIEKEREREAVRLAEREAEREYRKRKESEEREAKRKLEIAQRGQAEPEKEVGIINGYHIILPNNLYEKTELQIEDQCVSGTGTCSIYVH